MSRARFLALPLMENHQASLHSGIRRLVANITSERLTNVLNATTLLAASNEAEKVKEGFFDLALIRRILQGELEERRRRELHMPPSSNVVHHQDHFMMTRQIETSIEAIGTILDSTISIVYESMLKAVC